MFQMRMSKRLWHSITMMMLLVLASAAIGLISIAYAVEPVNPTTSTTPAVAVDPKDIKDAPDEILEKLHIVDAEGLSPVRTGGSDDNTLRIWQRGAESDKAKLTMCVKESSETEQSEADVCTPVDTLNQTSPRLGTFDQEGKFVEDDDNSIEIPSVNSGDVSYVYVKLGEDVQVGENILSAGQVVKLPVVHDADAPSVTNVELLVQNKSLDLSDEDVSVSDGTLHTDMNGIEVRFTVTDLDRFSADADTSKSDNAVSGVDTESILASYADTPLTVRHIKDSVYALTLSAETTGISDGESIDLTQVRIQASDIAGNAMPDCCLDAVDPFKDKSVTSIQVTELSKFDNLLSTQIKDVCGSTGLPSCSATPGSSLLYVQKSSSEISLVPSDQFKDIVDTMPWLSPTVHYEIGKSGKTIDVPAKNVADGTAFVELPRQGEYAIKFTVSIGLPSFSSMTETVNVHVLLDDTAPTVTFTDATQTSDTVRLDDGTKVIATYPGSSNDGSHQAKFEVKVVDSAPSSDSSAAVSGVDWTEGHNPTVSYVRYDTLEAALANLNHQSDAPAGEHISKMLSLEDGKSTVTFTQDGAYLVNDITVKAQDKAGNEAAATHPADAGYKIIVVDGDADDSAISMELQDDAANEPSEDSDYHRGTVTVKITVNDKWYEVARRLPTNDKAVVNGTVTGTFEAKKTTLSSLSHVDVKESVQGVWQVDYKLPTSTSDAKHRTVEGWYELLAQYQPINGELKKTSSKFGVDYTAPVFGKAAYKAMEHLAWGMLFVDGSQTVTIPSTDNLAGVNDASVEFNGKWSKSNSDHPAKVIAQKGEVGLHFDDDSSRLTINGSMVSIADVAGNRRTVNLADLNSNLPEGATGIVIDATPASFNVAYDNNDVRNGKYYKAHRTATVTLNESNFDFIKANDERRVIITTTADGTTRKILAKDFENPSGDGATWVTSVPFDRDADWTVDASFTDPTGHKAEPFHDAFTIDTVKPLLIMRFDNNDSQNGNYYKSPRTATIAQTERNFSAGESKVTVTATDAAGNAAATPVPSGWSEASERYERNNTVAFPNELHYTLTVTATDLAGNVAEEVSEPEFVIDTTKPKVRITQVSDTTAYAGDIKPHIEFEDTNFDPLFAEWKLTRTRDSRTGKIVSPKDSAASVWLQTNEQTTNTNKTVDLPDMEHIAANDDVYTLTAAVQDKAGNEAKQTVVYSVNRFGSNYIVSDETADALGQYLNKPRQVQVKEINVSGLKSDQTHVELAHDAAVSVLQDGRDYQSKVDDDSGWQQTTYTFPASSFEADGYYRLLFTSTDKAGNLSQNTMDAKDENRSSVAEVNFAVDQHAPTAAIAQLSSHDVMYAPKHNFVIDAKDGLAVQSAELKVDGNTVAQWKGESMLDQMVYAIDADEQSHDIELIVCDKAGNVSTATYSDVVVASSFWAYLSAKGLLIPGIAAGIILIGLAGIAAALAIRHRRRNAYQRNMFGRSAS